MSDLPVVLLAIGAPEIIVVLLIVVVLFGATKIPQLARSLGKAKSEFEAGKREGEKEGVEEARLAGEARELGLDPTGKDTSELRRMISQARQGRS